MESSFRSSFAGQVGNFAALRAAEEALLTPGACNTAPYVAALAFAADDFAKPKYPAVAKGFDRRLSPVNVGIAIQQEKRRIAFERKLEADFHAAVIVVCGDSWFQFPLRLKEIVDEFEGDDDKAIIALRMPRLALIETACSELLTEEFARWDAHVMMLSLGGNKRFGEGRLAGLFQSLSYGAEIDTLIIQSLLEQLLAEIKNDLVALLSCVEAECPGIFLVAHAYDTLKLREDGLWIDKASKARSMPLSMAPAVPERVLRQVAGFWEGSSGTRAPSASSTSAADSDLYPAAGWTISTRGIQDFHARPTCAVVALRKCLGFRESERRKT